jgi:phosphomannomutase
MDHMGQSHFFCKARSFAAVAIGTSFLFTTVATPLVEANFWEQRRDATRRVNGKAPSSRTLLAQLPGSMGPMDGVLPVVNGALGSALQSVPPADLSGVSTPADRRAMALPSWLRGLPTSAGEIRDVALAKNAETAPVVVLVQDVHNVFSAQKNIAEIVSHIESAADRDNRGPVLIGLEGGVGAFDIKRFRAFRGNKGHRLASELLLKTNIISGPEYHAFLSDREPLLWGIETRADYIENAEAVRASQPATERVTAALTAAQRAVEAKGEDVFSKDLKDLNKTLAAHAQGTSPIVDLVRALRARVPKAPAPEVDKLQKALDTESGLDFAQVERERATLIEILVRTLDTPSIDRLVSASLNYRSGRMSFGAYHAQLKELVKGHGIRWSDYAAFDQYVHYVLLAESIDKFRLFDELEDLKLKAVAASGRTVEEKTVMGLAEDLRLVARLVRHEFGPAEWKAYSAHKNDVSRLSARLSDVLGANALSCPSKEDLALFERFYVAADRRNESLASNLLAKAKETDSKIMMLVAGGFHTPELERLLKAKGLSVVTITPTLGEIPKGSHYLDIFLVKNIPLEQFLQGEKLYFSPPRVNAEGTLLPDVPTTRESGDRLFGAVMQGTAMLTSDGNPSVLSEMKALFQGVTLNSQSHPGSVSVTARTRGGQSTVVVWPEGSRPEWTETGAPLGVKATDGEISAALITGARGKGDTSFIPSLRRIVGNGATRVSSGTRAIFDSWRASKKYIALLSLTFISPSVYAGDFLVFLAAAPSLLVGAGFLTGALVVIALLNIKRQENLDRFQDPLAEFLIGRSRARVRYAFGSLLGFLFPNYRRTVQVPGADLMRELQMRPSSWVAPLAPGYFTEHNLGRFAQAAADTINESNKSQTDVLVGFDTRSGARQMAVYLARVLQANGLKVRIADKAWPTSGGAEASRSGGDFHYAFWVTAGSNPKLANVSARTPLLGVKMFREGVPAGKSFVKAISQRANTGEGRSTYKYSRRRVKTFDIASEEQERLSRVFGYSKEGWWPSELKGRVVVDSMHGASAANAAVLETLGIVGKRVNSSPMSGVDLGMVPKNGGGILWAPDPREPVFIRDTLDALSPGEWGFFFDGGGERLVVAEKPMDGGPVRVFNGGELSLMMGQYLIDTGEKGNIRRTLPATRWLDRLARANSRSLTVLPLGSDDIESAMRVPGLLTADAGSHLVFRRGKDVFVNSAMAQAVLVLEMIKTHGNLSDFLRQTKERVLGYPLQKELNRAPTSREISYALKDMDLFPAHHDFVVPPDHLPQILKTRSSPALASSFGHAVVSALRSHGVKKYVKRVSRDDPNGLLLEFTDGTWLMWKQPGALPIFRLYAEQESPEVLGHVLTALHWVLDGARELTSLQLSIDELYNNVQRAEETNSRESWVEEADSVYSHVRSFLELAEAMEREILDYPSHNLSGEIVPLEILRGVSVVMELPQMSFAIPAESLDSVQALQGRLTNLAIRVGTSLEKPRVDSIEEMFQDPEISQQVGSKGLKSFMADRHVVHVDGRAQLEQLPPNSWAPYTSTGEMWAPYLTRDLLKELLVKIGLTLDENDEIALPQGIDPLLVRFIQEDSAKKSKKSVDSSDNRSASQRLLDFAKYEGDSLKSPDSILAVAAAVEYKISNMEEFGDFCVRFVRAMAYLKTKELWAAKRDGLASSLEAQEVLQDIKGVFTDDERGALGLDDRTLAMRAVALNQSWEILRLSAQGKNPPASNFIPRASDTDLTRSIEIVLLGGGRASRWNDSNTTLIERELLKPKDIPSGPRQTAVHWLPDFNGISLAVDSLAHSPTGGRLSTVVSPFTWVDIMRAIYRSRGAAGNSGSRVPVHVILQNPGEAMVLDRKGLPALDEEGNIRRLEGVVLGHGNVRGALLGMLNALRDGVPYGLWRAGDGPLAHLANPRIKEVRDRMVYEAEQGFPLAHVAIGNWRSPGQTGGGAVSVNGTPNMFDTLIPNTPNDNGFVANRDITLFSTFENAINYAGALYAISDGVSVAEGPLLSWSDYVDVSALKHEALHDLSNRITQLSPEQIVLLTNRFMDLLPSEYVEKKERDMSFVQWEQISGMWHGALPNAIRERMRREGIDPQGRPMNLAHVDISLNEVRILAEGDMSNYSGPLPTFAEVKSAPGLHAVIDEVQGLLLRGSIGTNAMLSPSVYEEAQKETARMGKQNHRQAGFFNLHTIIIDGLSRAPVRQVLMGVALFLISPAVFAASEMILGNNVVNPVLSFLAAGALVGRLYTTSDRLRSGLLIVGVLSVMVLFTLPVHAAVPEVSLAVGALGAMTLFPERKTLFQQTGRHPFGAALIPEAHGQLEDLKRTTRDLDALYSVTESKATLLDDLQGEAYALTEAERIQLDTRGYSGEAVLSVFEERRGIRLQSAPVLAEEAGRLTNDMGAKMATEARAVFPDRSLRATLLSALAAGKGSDGSSYEQVSAQIGEAIHAFSAEIFGDAQAVKIQGILKKMAGVAQGKNADIVVVDQIQPGVVKAIHLDETADPAMIQNVLDLLGRYMTPAGDEALKTPGTGVVVTVSPGLADGPNANLVQSLFKLRDLAGDRPIKIHQWNASDGLVRETDEGLVVRVAGLLGLLKMNAELPALHIQCIAPPASTVVFNKEGLPDNVLVERIKWLLEGIGLRISSDDTENEIRSLIATLKAA